MLDRQQQQQVDRYQLRGVLGEGAMGRVYLAYDPKFNREVALKTMKETVVEDERIRKWFHREARAMAQLQHPGIVEVHDYSGAEAQAPYLVMERLRGHTLTDVVNARGALPALVLADIAIQLGAALAHAHEAGLVHRDLKPDNIFLEPSGRVVITDFGLARAQLNVDLGASLASAGTSVVGTPLYLAPETIHDPRASGPQSDIYAVGVVLYFCATLELPFVGEDPFQALSRILGGHHKRVHELQPSLQRSVADAIERTFAFDPARRPQSGQQLAEVFTTAVGLTSGSPVDTHGALGQFLAGSAELATFSEATRIGEPPRMRTTAEQLMGGGTSPGIATKQQSGAQETTAGQPNRAQQQTRIANVAGQTRPAVADTDPEPRASLPTLGPRSSATHVLKLAQLHAGGAPKSKKWLWVGVILVLALAGVAAAFLLNPSDKQPTEASTPTTAVVIDKSAPTEATTPPAPQPSAPIEAALPTPSDLPKVDVVPPEPSAQLITHTDPDRADKKPKPRNNAVASEGPPGTLRVNTGPVYTDIYIRGEKVGSTPIQAQVSLPPGKHTVRLVSPDYGSQEHHVVIVSDKDTVLKAAFKK